MSKTWKWTDANFCSLPSHTTVFGSAKPQTNVYSHSKVADPGGSNKLLLASLSGKFIYIEYQKHFDNLIPTSKEIQFTYIPADAEIISLDVISRSSHRKTLIVGVTFLKVKQSEESESTTLTQYLNLYSSLQPGEECLLESVAQEVVSIELNFTPYQLTHTELIQGDCRETVFLLSGSDQCIHMYREVVCFSTIQRFPQNFGEEVAVNEMFPESTKITGCVHWLDIKYKDNFSQRLSVLGQQDGAVIVSVVDVLKSEILRTWSTMHDSPITRVKIFRLESDISPPSCLNSLQGFTPCPEDEKDKTIYDVLVLSALETSVMYSDVFNQGFTKEVTLPDSDKYDVPLCVCILDIDFDGQDEVLVGTYGQELLAYKWYDDGEYMGNENKSEHSSPSKDDPLRNRHKSMECKSSVAQDTSVISPKSKSQENITSILENLKRRGSLDRYENEEFQGQSETSKSGFRLLWKHSFPCPVMGVAKLDIVGDGMDDLIVITLNGVHIIQPDLGDIYKMCLERLQSVTKSVFPEVGKDEKYSPVKDSDQDTLIKDVIEKPVKDDINGTLIKGDDKT
ncbi:hypothetical protein FSP39_022563 [Pinctada imbricata]|uniref:KICSTOR complex protein kaptin n=1 Tax=Pinctada imbricata TaxID=66713 RepID=A0AA89C437_PINIB|nr:hypothetical protein FSP39_022563 [Pinctada imbricata]